MNRIRAVLCVVLSGVVAIPECRGQSSEKLNIVVVEGNGVINDIHQRTGRELVVRVEDADGKPIRGVVLAFAMPTEGATAAFADGSKMLVTVTNEQGTAIARVVNQVGTGPMAIRVNASYEGRTASTRISQVNMLVPQAKKSGGSSSKLTVILVVVGAAAAGGALALTRSKQSQPGAVAPAAIGISPGTGTFGPPQ